MITKRGLSSEELKNIDPELFEYLYIFDSVIEPNGARFDQMKFANLAHLILLSSGNLTEKGMKSASVMDWDMFGLLSNKSSTERIEEEEKKKQDHQTDQFNAMANLIKEEATKKKNKDVKINGKV